MPAAECIRTDTSATGCVSPWYPTAAYPAPVFASRGLAGGVLASTPGANMAGIRHQQSTPQHLRVYTHIYFATYCNTDHYHLIARLSSISTTNQPDVSHPYRTPYIPLTAAKSPCGSGDTAILAPTRHTTRTTRVKNTSTRDAALQGTPDCPLASPLYTWISFLLIYLDSQ